MSPFVRRRTNVMVIETVKAMTRKAATGWRTTRRLSIEGAVACCIAVDVDMINFRSNSCRRYLSLDRKGFTIRFLQRLYIRHRQLAGEKQPTQQDSPDGISERKTQYACCK